MLINLKQIIEQTAVAIDAHVSYDPKHTSRILANIRYNKNHWMYQFDKIILSFNGDYDTCNSFLQDIKNIVGNKCVLLHSENLGKILGNTDNDSKIFNYTKDNNDIKYILKISYDTLGDNIQDIQIDTNYDFFYINHITPNLLNSFSPKELFHAIKNHSYFQPQNNYYIVKNKIANYYPNQETLLDLKNNNFHNIVLDEDIDICNDWLKHTIEKNNLKIYHLLNDDSIQGIINIIQQYPSTPDSHKNILYKQLGGICHYHYPIGRIAEV
jgi:hypothetical protein